LHAAEQRQADDRPLLERRIGILVVDLRLAGGGIDRFAQPHHDAADACAAFADPHPGISRLGQPGAADIAAGLRHPAGRGEQGRQNRKDQSESAGHHGLPEKLGFE